MSNWCDLYIASVPDGADLVSSRDTPGWFRGFYRGADGISGHAEFAKLDVRAPAAIVMAITVAVTVVGTVALTKNAPRIQSWWEGQVIPAAEMTFRRITREGAPRSQSPMSELPSSELVVQDFSYQVDVALEDATMRLSSEGAQRHLLEIMMAASIIAYRMRAVSDARLEDDAHPPELGSAIEKLTTQQVTDTINRILEANASLLDDETSAIFAEIFGGGQVVDMEYVPLRNESVKEALRLPGLETALPHAATEAESSDLDTEEL